MEVISQNIANANTTKAENGEPYRRQLVHFDTILRNKMGRPNDVASNNLSQVEATKIIEDSRPFREVYQPGHPDANKDGMVRYPNVHIHEEMADLDLRITGIRGEHGSDPDVAHLGHADNQHGQIIDSMRN